MDDKEINAPHMLDLSVVCEVYHSVDSGKHLADDTISNIVLRMRNQLQTWRDKEADSLHARDLILLCLSTLSRATKKKSCLCQSVLDVMTKGTDFSLIVNSFVACSVLVYTVYTAHIVTLHTLEALRNNYIQVSISCSKCQKPTTSMTMI